tara:strand:- start:29473 stop:30009 length:537 start_codon:yes stop_codon:yes gene_type:complete
MLNMLKQKSIIGVYTDENTAADALDALNSAGYETNEYEILTGTPYPEGTFGEHEPKHTLYRWPLIGAACGFIVGLMLTAGTQIAYPLVTGGKPVLGIPPMAIIMYEGTMLGAILFTIIGILFESRLPRLFMGAYDTRITEGYIGITVTTSHERIEKAEEVLHNSGAQDISKGWEENNV